jgi:hypothetical protein
MNLKQKIASMVQNQTPWLMKDRFFILCFLVFVVMCLHTRNGQWHGDFWEHSAVVRELATHILHPKHPQLLLDAPHAFYSPYAVMVALLARTLHLDAVTALSIMGLVNLGLFFLGFWLFVFALVPRHRSATAFYALLLTLFCWGSHPWVWSGFFHISAMGYVLPYPSTFAAALTLIVLGVNRLRVETSRQILLVPIFLIATTVLLSHPTTFLFLAVGLISQSCCAAKVFVPSQIVLIGSLLILAFLFAAFWPYFPLLGLFSDVSTSMRDSDSRVMYQHVMSSIWPSLIGVPLIIAGMRSNWRRPVVLMLVILSGIYLFGAISGKYSCGRLISYIVLLFHVAIAEHLSMLESRVGEMHTSIRLQRLILPASVMVLTLLLSLKPLISTLGRSFFEQPPTYKSYLFLSRFTGQYDVVMSDIESSWIVPTFGGKVVAASNPVAFVPDIDVRSGDLNRFFKRDALLSERQQIIQKYGANYLLIKKSENVGWQDLQQSFMLQGKVVFESDSFVLISLKRDPGKDATLYHNDDSRAFVKMREMSLHQTFSHEL